jgi:uncharacterized lipoprotein YajG
MNTLEDVISWKHCLIPLFAAWLMSGCALTPEAVQINPQVQNVAAPTVATGQSVSLSIIDLRPSEVIGNRGITGTAYGGANVSTNGDITQVLQTVIADNLTARGFIVTPTKRKLPGIQLRVEINNLQYAVVPGIITGTLRTEASLHAECLHDQMSQYDHVHRGLSEAQVFFAQFAHENEAHINKSVSNAITAMLDDTDLMSCLSGH